MQHETRVYESVFEMLPDEDNPTPIVRINRMNPNPGFALYAKLEWMNPFGSVKDRAASFLLRQLEEQGKVSEERGVIEPTSGNTGISLAAMASAKGYPFKAVIPNRVPMEKRLALRLAGAELEVISDEMCPAPGLGDGSINLAKSHARSQPDRYVMPNQYENEANVEAHFRTTGPEIWKQTGGRVTHVVTSLGTCGTITGISKFLKSKNPDVRIVAVQPTEGHDVPGLRNISQLDSCKLFDPSAIDEIMELDYELAYQNARELFRTEGLRAGPSSGLIFEGGRRLAMREPAGLCVMIFCDDVFKYTSNMSAHLPDLADGTLVPDSEPVGAGSRED